MQLSCSSQALLIAGPTASGKSSYALKRACDEKASIINADSMQVYQDLHILTARPSDEDEALCPHHLYGHVKGCEDYSVARWLGEAGQILENLKKQGIKPIFTGGTGLYFKALTEGLSPVPPIDPVIREKWRDAALFAEPGELHRILQDKDPAMAERLQAGDTQRIVRALEVMDSTGRSLLTWQQQCSEPLLDVRQCETIIIDRDRNVLEQRIRQRAQIMLNEGGVEEALALQGQGYSPDKPVMRAIGVSTCLKLASGTLTKQQALDEITVLSRRYVKRQQTFFRGQMPEWRRINPDITNF
jgi:tRNA dimethylallyltransferase